MEESNLMELPSVLALRQSSVLLPPVDKVPLSNNSPCLYIAHPGEEDVLPILGSMTSTIPVRRGVVNLLTLSYSLVFLLILATLFILFPY